MPNIFFCDGVITQKELGKFDDVFKDLLARGPSHGDNIEHIKNSVFSIRNNKKERVFFLFHEFQNKRYIVVL